MIIFNDSGSFEQSYDLVSEKDTSGYEERKNREDGTRSNETDRRAARASIDEQRRLDQLRVLGCWIFGSTLRI